MDLGVELVKFDNSNNKYFVSTPKPKNTNTQHMIINKYPNAKIKKWLSKVKCPERNKVKISDGIVAFDALLVEKEKP